MAQAILGADRGHTGIGSWDIALPCSEVGRLETIEALVRASALSYLHWSLFSVAEAGGGGIGAAAGYVPSLLAPMALEEACREVLGEATTAEVLARRAWSQDFFTVSIAPQALRLEWVYTTASERRRGVSASLTERVLSSATHNGISNAYVGTYIGNRAAIATYRRLQFVEFAECRHTDYESQFRAPGLVFLRRTLSPPPNARPKT